MYGLNGYRLERFIHAYACSIICKCTDMSASVHGPGRAYLLFERECVHTAVISALPAKKSATREASRDRGVAGTHFQSARRFSGFYAAPRWPLEFGTFFAPNRLRSRPL